MKRTIKLLLVCALLFQTLLFFGCEGAEGDIDTDAYYKLPESPAEDFVFREDDDGVTVIGYNGSDETVVVPAVLGGKSVVCIATEAFAGNQNTKTLVLPNGLLRVSEKALGTVKRKREKSALETVILPETVIELGGRAFRNFINLKTVNIPDSVVLFGGRLFENCSSLKSIRLTKAMFNREAEGLKDREYENGIAMFNNSGIESAEIPKGVTEIPTEMFQGTPLESVKLPKGLKIIGRGAFAGTMLTDIELPKSLEIIKPLAFYGSKLESAELPSSVREVCYNSFGSAEFKRLIIHSDAPENFFGNGIMPEPINGRYEIHYEPSAKGYEYPRWNGYPTRVIGKKSEPKTINGLEYVEIDGGIKITAYIGSDIDITVPESIDGLSVISIADNAFYMRDDIFSVKLPESIKTIGENAFRRCESLVYINFPSGLEEIKSNAFVFCTSLDSALLGGNLKRLGDSAFGGCGKLESVTLPETLQTIGESVFSNTALIEIKVPASVKTICSNSFDLIKSLSAVYFEGDAPEVTNSPRYDEGGNFLVYRRENAQGFSGEFWDKYEIYTYWCQKTSRVCFRGLEHIAFLGVNYEKNTIDTACIYNTFCALCL